MTNNDELALKLKAAAEKALPAIEKYEAGEIDGDDALEMLSDFTDVIKPANILSLLAERDADKKRIADMQTIVDAAEKLVRCKGRYHSEQNYRALAALFGVKTPELPPLETEARTVSVKLPDEFYTIADNIRTQENRITSEPMFCVYQKREIAVDSDCDYDRIVWVDEDGNEASEHKSARLESLHENFREPPDGWRRVAVKDVDDFVTCCFTERGCKDYLACNGHNLRLPFIYVKSGFRNAEYISIRNWLAGIKLEVGE